MAENIVVNGVTYNGVDSVIMQNTDGKSVGFYPDAVRYSEQDLSDEQKQQAIENIGALSKSQLSSAVDEALSKAVSSGEFKGRDGEDGISATHSWSGTTLTVTSASGTSSANLKGERGLNGERGSVIFSVKYPPIESPDGYLEYPKSGQLESAQRGDYVLCTGNNSIYQLSTDPFISGDQPVFTPVFMCNIKGDPGDPGKDGKDATNPVKGTDYWTADDIAEMESYIDSAVTDTFGKGTSIPSGSDLDTYTTIGKYYASSNSSAQSLVNSPTTRNFMMYVFIRTTDNVPSQLIIDLVGQMYIRSRSSSSWGSWVTYITKTDLTSAVTAALQDAKDSGEFDGVAGQRGTGLLPVTTAPSSYTTAVGGIKPKYRMALSTIKTQSGATEVLLGDTIRYSYYHYPIDYLDATYAYCETRVSIRGAAGAAGTTPVKGTDYFTDDDKAEIVGQLKSSMPTLTMSGVDENGVAHTWIVYGVAQE